MEPSVLRFLRIHALVSDYLRPLADLKATKKSKPDPTLIRSLAKRFLSFLNSSLSILPKRLPELSKSNDAVLLLELLRVYRLCLDCLDTVAFQLASKPFSVEFQRLRFMHCLESCALFAEADVEGLGVLERLRQPKRKGKLLPEIDKGGGGSKDLCSLIVDIAVSLVRCASAGLAKEDGDFKKVLQLVEEVTPWLKQDSAYKKFGNVDGYSIYKKEQVYGNLPAWFKTALLLEFPFYSRNLPQEENW
ncbi:separase [Vigna unguiculata]|uniref:Separase n=1 Tax=Vigna unguiculata TaxID=3917 RepID=A0A4D6LKA7_VIGUN|nr:separase [Vigna unguiculata]